VGLRFRSPFWLVLTSVIALAGTTRDRNTSQSDLNNKLAVWKQRLNLGQWSVSVVMSDPSDLRPGTLGNIHWDPEKKTAVIRVLDRGMPDMEDTLVHELVHLELSSLPKTDASRSDEEFAVNRLAQALLELERKPEATEQ
jgi:hypothetical protein